MSKVEIFDPAMCCSTGVCGPGVDPELLRMSAIINALEGEGIKIHRYGLSQNPEAFMANTLINEILINDGVEALPVTIVDGELKQMGTYPTNADLATWAGMSKEALVQMIINARKTSGGCCGGDSGCC